MERRDFLKASCSACLLGGFGLALSNLTSCSSSDVYETRVTGRTVTIPRSAIKGLLIVQPENLDYDIALVQREGTPYVALLMQCTHASNPVHFDGTGYTCPLHGSRFSQNGQVVRGPASRPLRELKTRVEGENVVVEIL